jgi:hypothetical protein
LQKHETEHEEEHSQIIRALQSMTERGTDLKHLMQLCQDVEMIKRVVFQERHLLLGPIIALEYEKRSLKRYDERLEAHKENEDNKAQWMRYRDQKNKKGSQTHIKKKIYDEKGDLKPTGSKDSPKDPEQPLPIYMKGGHIEMIKQSTKDGWETPMKHLDDKHGNTTESNFTNIITAGKIEDNKICSDPEMG